jgi:hypothetical protein
MNKLKIKEQSFQITANIDERIKTSKNRVIVKNPNPVTIRPKPNGIVLNQRKDTDVYKQDNGAAIFLKRSDGTAVYKQYP